jgi:hypothetical protein
MIFGTLVNKQSFPRWGGPWASAITGTVEVTRLKERLQGFSRKKPTIAGFSGARPKAQAPATLDSSHRGR